MIIIAFFIAHWYLSLFFQTVFLHRYAAHEAFTMSRRMEKVFFFLTWFFQGPSYLSAYGYGVMHRMHHAFADTEKDPHSPKYDETIMKMMWKTKTIYSSIIKRTADIEPRFTEGVPQWEAFDKFARSWVSRLVWSIAFILLYVQFATSPWLFLLLPLNIAIAPVHGVIINWFAHVYGYRNFEVGDTSKNLLPFDFLMMGESYHNNHHKYGTRANFGGIRWHEIDPSYQIIKLLGFLGIIKLKKSPEVKLERPRKMAA